MRFYLALFLIVLVVMIVVTVILTGIFYGISLIIMGADVVREMGEMILVK